MNKMNKKGFTLIEILIVIAIIAILVSIVVPAVSNSTIKAKASTDAANLRSVLSELSITHLSANKSGATATATAKNFTLTYTNGKLTGCTINDVCPKSEALTTTTAVTVYYQESTDSFLVAYGNYGIEDMALVAETGTLHTSDYKLVTTGYTAITG